MDRPTSVVGSVASAARRFFSHAKPSVRILKARRGRGRSGSFFPRNGAPFIAVNAELEDRHRLKGAATIRRPRRQPSQISPSGGGLWPPRRLPFQLESRSIRL